MKINRRVTEPPKLPLWRVTNERLGFTMFVRAADDAGVRWAVSEMIIKFTRWQRARVN